ncbi:TPA: hypothetical protein ACV5CR_001134 [Klebsiella aerogenes]|nr:hypothetical protein [Klebsiella aerogenes]HBR6986905.1 hypothetical protein [Klebsiella aerogenes]
MAFRHGVLVTEYLSIIDSLLAGGRKYPRVLIMANKRNYLLWQWPNFMITLQFIIQCRKVGGGMYINYVTEKEEDDPTRAPESGDKQPERDK